MKNSKESGLLGTIVLFDSHSLVQNKLIQFLSSKNKAIGLNFISTNSKIGMVLLEKLNLSSQQLENIVLLENGQCYTQSLALKKLNNYV